MDKDLTPYLERIRASLPGLAISTVRLNPDGLANDVLIVNDELVFRFPKNEAGRENLRREGQLLEVVRRHVTLATPHFERREEAFVMYRFMPGRPLYRHDLLRQPAAVQERLAEQLATFLRQLHTIPLAELEAAGLRFDPAEDRLEPWRRRFQESEQALYPFLWADQRDWLIQLFAPVLEGRLDMGTFPPGLTHNDLASYHILYDPDRQQLNGVIDFGMAQVGDPADDLGLIINTYGESFLQRMRRYYPEIEPALDRARFRAGVLEVDWALAGVRTKDPAWFLVHLGRARDVMPVS